MVTKQCIEGKTDALVIGKKTNCLSGTDSLRDNEKGIYMDNNFTVTEGNQKCSGYKEN